MGEEIVRGANAILTDRGLPAELTLSDESGVTLTDVQISYPSDDTMRLRLYFSWSGGSFSTDQIIRS